MSYRVSLGHHNEVQLPDALCQELGIEIGDIMVFGAHPDYESLIVTKHSDQALTDDEIMAAGNLARVIPYVFEHDQHFVE
ncbi:hypothetical protein [Alishewanella longhuensis]